MKAKANATADTGARFPTTPEERGIAAAKPMSKALLEEHRRWNMPFITWKNGKVVSVKV
ncbi:hypothetical protein OVA24_13675 [Luteolibacter sp. SL250]|uniref:hypothetical protein n=1 Tax=Luteolibacter sp. SL250 TaxID=2995170 RepID=UPI00226DB387|nr:hypothetical protein [Luteolibacter sp. SL250]WAC18284.1 hypothetical protein OVA24_13675 [Luteolibacter sp. SL250]